jgi:hypothetical protein
MHLNTEYSRLHGPAVSGQPGHRPPGYGPDAGTLADVISDKKVA